MCIRQKPTLHKIDKMLIFRGIIVLVLTIPLWFPQTSGLKVVAFERKTVRLENPLYLCWKYKTSGDYKIASDNDGNIYLIDLQNVLTGINTQNGLKNWETSVGGQFITEPLIYKENIIQIIQVVSKDSSYIIRSTNKLTGITNWQVKISQTDLQGKIFSRIFGDNFVIVSTGGNLISVNNSDGIIKQKKNIYVDSIISPFFDASKFYTVTQNNKVTSVSLSDFAENYELKVASLPTLIIVSGSLLLWGDKRGVVNASSLSSIGKKVKWRSRKGGEILSITKTSEGILASSSDNYIYLMSEKSGDLIWKRRLASRVAFDPVLSENYVLVSTSGEPETLIFDLKSGRMLNQITLSEGNLFSAAPKIFEKVIVFQTSEGLEAYSNDRCSEAK